MKTLGRNTAKLRMSGLVAFFLLASTGAAFSQVLAQSGWLKPGVVWQKPSHTLLTSKVRPDVIVVKFREGTHVRERLGQFEADLSGISAAEDRILQRGNLARQQIFQDLAQINAAVAPNSKRYIRRLFTGPENELDTEKRDGEGRIGEEVADLNLYFYILIPDATARDSERLLDQLNALDIVEIAYPQSIAAMDMTDLPVLTASAPTVPELRTYPLAADTNVSGSEQVLITEDLVLRAGESRRVLGNVNAIMKTPSNFQSIDYTVAVQCVDATGVPAGVPSYAETSLVPGKTDTLRPSMLFTAPMAGLYHCRLLAGSDPPGAVLIAHKGLTWLSLSAGDEVVRIGGRTRAATPGEHCRPACIWAQGNLETGRICSTTTVPRLISGRLRIMRLWPA